jgi:peptidyl-prolyl cis-trans isomerase SurA
MATRRSKSRAALAGAALVAALLGASACSNDTGGDTDATTATDDAGATSAPGGDQAAATADVADIPEVVAEVNGEPISRDDFVTAYEGQFQQASMQSQMGGEPVDQDALKQEVLDGLIGNTLLLQQVEEKGLEVSEEEIDSTLAELAQGNGMEPQDFLAALEQQGLTEEDVRAEVEKQVGTDKLIEQEAPVEDPTEEELRAFYDEVAAQQAPPTGEDGAAATDSPESALPPFEEVRPQVEEQVRAEKRSAAVQTYVDQLREDAEITTHL